MEERFKILEHPSETGVQAFGGNYSEALRNAALGLAHIIAPEIRRGDFAKRIVEAEAETREQLVVRWLQEFIFLFDTECFLPEGFEEASITDTSARAVCKGVIISRGAETSGVEVKAVTYHQLDVSMKDENCTIQVYFDI